MDEKETTSGLPISGKVYSPISGEIPVQAVSASKPKGESGVSGKVRGFLHFLGLTGVTAAAVASGHPGSLEAQATTPVPISTPDTRPLNQMPQVEPSVPQVTLQPSTAVSVAAGVTNAEQKNNLPPDRNRAQAAADIVGKIQLENMAKSTAESDQKRQAIANGGPSPVNPNESNPGS